MDVIGHPTGRLIERREPYAIDMDRVIAKAVETGTFLEINANPDRRDLNDVYAKAAAEAGVTLVIDSDAHWPRTLANMRYGVATARRAWLTAEHVANTRPWPELRQAAQALAPLGTVRSAARIVRLDLAQARQAQQLGRPERRAAVEPELHAVAALDRLDRARLLAPQQRHEQAVAGGDRRHLREEEAERAARAVASTASGQSRLNMHRPGLELGQRVGAARVGQQARDARRGRRPRAGRATGRRAPPRTTRPRAT